MWRNSGHPRVCGENDTRAAVDEAEIRAIPACAGRTQGGGEAGVEGIGPSPRVRGEPEAVTAQLPI